MKIPETTPNVGAYYGNEENGQWQPNGVIIDSGVGGGVVGSGDAGIHRPPIYPVHIPRGHPGYVMAGAYYPAAFPAPPQPQDDFADYMWMENEEEFDKQVMQQLEEEALMEQCIEAMLEDEQRERLRPNGHQQQHYPTTSNGASSLSLEETVSRSTLNPLAAEFVPTRARHTHQEDRAEPSEAPAEEPQKSEEVAPEPAPQDLQDNTEEPVQPQKDPPEVSAADLDKSDKKKERRDSKPKIEVQAKKPVKVDLKPKVKPQTVKSETKVVQKKKEVVKSVKSDTKVEEKVDEAAEGKPQPAPVEESQAPSGFKPVNYAAAAKANKPKKPSPVIDKPAPQTKTDKVKPIDKIEKKEKLKTEKVSVQRKNSTK